MKTQPTLVTLMALAIAWPAAAQAQQPAETVPAGCEMPRASDNAKVVLFSTGRGEGLSTSTIGSQDVTVSTGIITIEQGEEPVYIVGVTAEAVIWRLRGAIGRVERLVLSSNKSERGDPARLPLVGTTGISPDRILFPRRSDCIKFFMDAPSIASSIAASIVRQQTGKTPGIVTGRYAASEFVLPSGALGTNWNRGLPSTVDGSDPLALDAALTYPADITEIDPATVTASRPAERYKILPDTHGLLQLEKSGVLQRNKSQEFIIRKPMRFPADLSPVKFLLPRGVPAPDGDPGSSCVYSEETGQFSGAPSCKDRMSR